MSFNYPAPVLNAELSFEALRDQRIATFVEEWETFRLAHPDIPLRSYTLQSIQASPAVVALRTAAYGDVFFVSRSNVVARAAVLTDYARDGDLDLHGLATKVPAHPNGVARHPGESDADYAARIIEARAGSSAAGPDEWWLTHARAADARIRSIGLDYRGQGQLDVYLLSSENGGVPDQAMLDAVSDRLARPDVRPRNVAPHVYSAIIDEIDIVADVWLLPDAAEARLDELAARAKEKHNAEQALDVDLTHHYLKRLLDAADVYSISIVAPATDLLADPSRAYSIRSISPRLAGRAR